MSNPQILGTVALIIQLIANIPYIWGIVRGGVRPNRVSFFIFALLAIIGFISQDASGATYSNLLTLGVAFNTSVIFLLSLWRGSGGKDRFDLICLLLAIFGIVGWRVTGNPLVATIFVVLADFMGMVPTFKKTYIKPDSEGGLAWGIVTIAAVFSLIASGGKEFSIYLYPLYSFLANGIETLLILHRRYLLKNS